MVGLHETAIPKQESSVRVQVMQVLWAIVIVGGVLLPGCKPTPSSSNAGTSDNSDNSAVSTELQAFEGLTGKIDIAGGTAHVPVMNEAAKRISSANPEIRITVAGGGSGVGVKKVGEGLVEIGNTGRPVTDEEVAEYGLVSFPFALDGVAVVVHPDNPVSDLSAEKVKEIYAGNIVDWKDVNGPDGAVHIYTRDEASGTREVFWKKLLSEGMIASNSNVVPSNGAMKVAIGNDALAIGYISLGHVDDTVKAVDIDGQAPTQENAASGKYPVVRKLYMNTKGKPSDLVQTFIDYVRGPEGETIIRDAGFIPIQE